MRYAILSDIHGNLPALEAVLQDARAQGAEHFLFAGDYCISNPMPDECLSLIRSIPNKHVIRGNDDRHLERLLGQDPATLTDGQMRATYWCYRQMHQEHLSYLFALPHQVELTDNGVSIRMAHGSDSFIGECEYLDWNTCAFSRRYQGMSLTPRQIQQDMQRYFDEEPAFQEQFGALPDGVYIFGHTHIQWSYRSRDGKKWLINPGSCGLALDGLGGIPYVLMDIDASGAISVTPRRLQADPDTFIAAIRKSSLYREAPVWSRLIIQEFRTGLEAVSFFLQFVAEYAEKIGDARRPFSPATWENAYGLWSRRRKNRP